MLDRTRKVKYNPIRPPFPPRRVRRRLEGWRPVTVCIAAVCGSDEYIATVSDQMITLEGVGSSDDCVYKTERFWEDWSAMLAGDVGQASTILEMVREDFRASSDRPNTISAVRSGFKEVCRRRLAEIAGDRFLSPLGLDMSQFIERGKDIFPESTFVALSDDIRRVSLGCEFIVYGFDVKKRPRIFKVVEGAGTGPEDIDCGRPGFAAVGVGGLPADMILYYLNQNPDVPLEETIYNVCAAKFMAERVSGVGKGTFLHVKKSGSVSFSRAYSLEREIRESWEKDGAPKLPEGIIDKIRNSRLTF
jgi:hypothetical protein